MQFYLTHLATQVAKVGVCAATLTECITITISVNKLEMLINICDNSLQYGGM